MLCNKAIPIDFYFSLIRGYISTNGLFNDDDVTLSILISALQFCYNVNKVSIELYLDYNGSEVAIGPFPA